MNTLSPELLSPFLDIPNIKITNTERNNDEIFIYVDSLEAGANCHKCGKFTQDFHGYGSEINHYGLKPIVSIAAESRVFG
jgi:hypothetical protein